MKTLFRHLGLMALAAAMAVACTIEEPLVEEPAVEVPAAKASSVKVTVGAGIAADPATKSEVVTENGERVLKFTEGDKLYVYATVDDNIIMAGKLDIVPTSISDGTSASFTGNLALYKWDNGQSKYVPTTHEFTHEDPLVDCTDALAQLIHAGSGDYFKIDNDPTSHSFCLDFWYEYTSLPSDAVTFMTSYLDVTASDYDATNHRFVLVRPVGGAIFSCIVSGLTADANYSVSFPSSNHPDREQGTTQADAEGVARFAFDWIESSPGEKKAYSIILSNNAETHTIPLGERILEEKIYNVTRGLVTLTDETGEVTLKNNDILTGTGGPYTHVTIVDGAAIWLNGVTIVNTSGTAKDWAGITCLGDATINLVDGTTNTLHGFSHYYPGIYWPKDKTLTINGDTGALTASCYDTDTEGAAGIGSGTAKDYHICGNIVINGGHITAIGSMNAAGIGCASQGKCGDITIKGGYVEASSWANCPGIGSGHSAGGTSKCGDILISGGIVIARGGACAPGIGSAITDGSKAKSICGTVTITTGITSVTAIRDKYSPDVIGTANEDLNGDSQCGVITFGSQSMYDGSAWTITPTSGSDYGGLHIVISRTNEDNDTWTLTRKQP